MDVVEDPEQPGKMWVLFNGTEIPCWHDTDCQDAGICAVNQSWLVSPDRGTCMCNTKFGLTGSNCTEWCGEAVAIVIVHTLAAVMGLGIFLMSIWMLLMMWRRHRWVRCCRCNPVVLTLLFTAMGSVCFVVAPILAMVVSLGFPYVYIIAIDPLGRMIKRTPQSLEYANSIIYALGYCMTVCSFVLLPLVWIARSSLRLRKVQTSLVIGFTIAIVIVILVVELPFYVLISSRFRTEAGTWAMAIVIGWGLIYSFIIILNVLAVIRITEFKHMSQSPEQPEMRRMLTRIQVTALLIALASLCALVLGSLFHARSLRGFYTDPRCYVDSKDIAFRASGLFVLAGAAVSLWFVFPSVRDYEPGISLSMQPPYVSPAPQSVVTSRDGVVPSGANLTPSSVQKAQDDISIRTEDDSIFPSEVKDSEAQQSQIILT